jgi:hypothetical protein
MILSGMVLLVRVLWWSLKRSHSRWSGLSGGCWSCSKLRSVIVGGMKVTNDPWRVVSSKRTREGGGGRDEEVEEIVTRHRRNVVGVSVSWCGRSVMGGVAVCEVALASKIRPGVSSRGRRVSEDGRMGDGQR